jgi:hypothetical protein
MRPPRWGTRVSRMVDLPSPASTLQTESASGRQSCSPSISQSKLFEVESVGGAGGLLPLAEAVLLSLATRSRWPRKLAARTCCVQAQRTRACARTRRATGRRLREDIGRPAPIGDRGGAHVLPVRRRSGVGRTVPSLGLPRHVGGYFKSGGASALRPGSRLSARRCALVSPRGNAVSSLPPPSWNRPAAISF